VHGVRAFIALGANIGDPVACLRAALADIGGLPHTALVARSSVYRSAAVGLTDQPDFYNAVVAVDTGLAALDLLHALFAIEARHGRVRSILNAPRTLDLDLLLYAALQQSEPELILPHPRMHQRAFVLLPLTEIAPDAEIPGLGAAHAFLPAVAAQAIVRDAPL
jgi:2-amino-4-hydroxy-6-hydroxymethyldihydropteridine diphosphokinase